jgi:hypothetical protein
MKYLVNYKIFENLLNYLLSDISDILLEVRDMGFNTQVDTWTATDACGLTNQDIIEITISKNKHYMRYGGRTSEFRYSEIEDTVDRLIDYISQNNMVSTVNFGRSTKGGYRIIDLESYKPKASIIFCKLYIKKS